MRDDEKPFVCTRNGASFNIMPRNAAGWRYTGLWTIPALIIGGTYAWIMEDAAGDTRFAAIATVGFVILLLAWAAAMVRWMYVRSEVIDVAKLLGDERTRSRRRP